MVIYKVNNGKRIPEIFSINNPPNTKKKVPAFYQENFYLIYQDVV